MAGYTVSSVTAGKYARQVTVAASGPQGAQGPQGMPGAQGATGTPGGLSARYKFLNSYSAANPGSGYFAFNNATFMSATEMYISATDAATDSQLGLLAAAIQSNNSRKSIVTLQKVSDPRKFSRFYVTGGVSNSGWYVYQVEYIDGSVLGWSYNEATDILVSPIGDKGSQGLQGPQGAPGQGVPTGGLAGQILRKTTGTDFATEWVDPQAIEDVHMSEIKDVNLSALADGQVLIYSESTHTWVPVSPESLPQSAQTLSGTIEGGSATTF